MSYSYLTDNKGLSNILAQLLGQPAQPRKGTNRDGEVAEESDLALAIRQLLEPAQEQSPSGLDSMDSE